MRKLSIFILGIAVTLGMFGLLVMPTRVVQADDVTVSATVQDEIAFSIAAVTSGTVNGATINIETTAGVPPTVPFGAMTTTDNKVGAHNLTVTTNATNGYTVYVKYDDQLTHTNATNKIANISHTNAEPGAFTSAGTEGFGYTTEDSSLGTGTADRFTSTPGDKWAAYTASDAEVVYHNAAVTDQTTKVGYRLTVALTTLMGAYTSTVTYTATPHTP
jgi:hypothetical protein